MLVGILLKYRLIIVRDNQNPLSKPRLDKSVGLQILWDIHLRDKLLQ